MAKPPKLRRERRRAFAFDKADVERRIYNFYARAHRSRDEDFELRRQRQAKYRMWRDAQESEDFADFPLPDMMTASSSMQDVLHNAVMSQSPPIEANATDRDHKSKEQAVTNTVHHQLFRDLDGETIVGDLIENFVNDGVYYIFVPWVKERRHVYDRKTFPPLPDDTLPRDYFDALLQQKYPDHARGSTDAEGWDWRLVRNNERFNVAFYTNPDNASVDMDISEEAVVFDGPVPIIMPYEDVLFPIRSRNLQAPGPSNPGGAPHCILRFYPRLGEIERLRRTGYYDLATTADIDAMSTTATHEEDDETQVQRDELAGQHKEPGEDEETGNTAKARERLNVQKQLTRLLVFDTYDIDGSGIEQDVVWTYILETKTLVRAARLTDMWPANPPKRPIIAKSLMNVSGRVGNLGLLELMEATHDLAKENIDQMVDGGNLANTPFFFYRPTSNLLAAQRIRLAAGEGYPVADPSRDVHFPRVSGESQAYRINMHALTTQMSEKLTAIGDLQLGRVPAGKSSALRTLGGIQTILGQGEARPERILRRLFSGLAELGFWMHQLNRHFLPRALQIQKAGKLAAHEDPYMNVKRTDLDADMRFAFNPTVLNTNKQVLLEILQGLFGLYVNELTLQLGVVEAEGIYRLLRDIGMVAGQDADRYLTAPSPAARLPKLLAEDALGLIIGGDMPPESIPEEGFQEHLRKLQEFWQNDRAGGQLIVQDPETGADTQAPALTSETTMLLAQYITDVSRRAAEEARRQQLLQAARAMAGGQGGSGQPSGAPLDGGQPPVNGGELLDETLPGAGGGANPGTVQ